MSLKWKVSLLASGLLAVTVAALTSALLWREGKALTAELEARRADLVGGLADVCRETIYTRQDLLLTNYLKRLKTLPAVKEAACVDRSGLLLGHTNPVLLQTRFQRTAAPDELEAALPVRIGEGEAGRALVVFSRAELRRQLDAHLAAARRRILGLSIPVAAAGAVGAFFLTALLLRPMGLLTAGARAIGAGQLDHVILLKGQDEMAGLAAEFNRMAGKLHELDGLKSDFVNSVTHDLKSPLAHIQAAVDGARPLVEARSPDAWGVLSEALDVVRDATRRLHNLVTSILEIAKIESGIVLDRHPSSLESVVERVVDAYRPAAKAKGLTLDLVLASEVPPLAMDEGKMERALANLVGNAVKFTPKGRVVVTLARREESATVSVADSGPGVPAEMKGRLFSKFSRARGQTAEGTGLGLSIVRGIVEAHGGSVSFADAPAGGSVFTVRLPAPEAPRV